MSAIPHQSTRLDFRLPTDQKALIERAASLQGQTLSQFAISILVQTARETIQQAAVTDLTVRDRNRFMKMLDAPAEPNTALKAAAKRYRARRG